MAPCVFYYPRMDRWIQVDRKSITLTFDLHKKRQTLPVERDYVIDFDHDCMNAGKGTIAAGWLKDLEVREDGLWAFVSWTDVGLQAVKDGHYRFCSIGSVDFDYPSRDEYLPCKEAGDALRRRVFGLDHISLTNNPAIKCLRPITRLCFGKRNEGVPMLPATTLRGAMALLVSSFAERIRTRPTAPAINNYFRQEDSTRGFLPSFSGGWGRPSLRALNQAGTHGLQPNECGAARGETGENGSPAKGREFFAG